MKKIVNSGLIVTSLLLSLTACGGKANLAAGPAGITPPATLGAASQQPSSYAGANPYAQPTYNYQAPEQAAAPRTPARPAPGTRLTPTIPVRTASGGVAPRTSAPTTRQPVAPRPGAAPAPRPAAAAPSADSVGRELIAKTRARFETLQNFVVTGSAFEKDAKGETRIKLKVAFQKPGQVRLDIVQHNNSMYNGTKLTYMAGGDKVTGRPGGALSFMKLTVPLSDERILSRRGYRLDQIDTNAITTRLLGNPALNPKILGKTTVGGREVAVLEFTNANTFDQRITRELLGIDMQDHFVRIHEMYEGQTLVYSLKLETVALDGAISAADFEV